MLVLYAACIQLLVLPAARIRCSQVMSSPVPLKRIIAEERGEEAVVGGEEPDELESQALGKGVVGAVQAPSGGGFEGGEVLLHSVLDEGRTEGVVGGGMNG